ncbi:hypothetical protein KKB99_08435 [bacterium]|nr:hypothetical protein [bacterium]MBU1026018.1 hypothetical protein [bacterium]
MLKIYLQIFGTIAIALIILLNYNVFVKKPNLEKISELKKEIAKLEIITATLDKVLTHRQHFSKLEDLQSQDYANVRVFVTPDFDEPQYMHRVQKLVDLSGCTTNGIVVSKITNVAKPFEYDEFKTKPKENLEASVKSFITTMDKYAGNPGNWQNIVGETGTYSSRLPFYMEIGAGKKYPPNMVKGFEIHRIKVNVMGNYTSVKKFLHLISQNRPFMQPVLHSFIPVNDKQGSEKIFKASTTILTFVDKNKTMQPIQVAKQG